MRLRTAPFPTEALIQEVLWPLGGAMESWHSAHTCSVWLAWTVDHRCYQRAFTDKELRICPSYLVVVVEQLRLWRWEAEAVRKRRTMNFGSPDHVRGHPIYHDGKIFRYRDTKEPAKGERRDICGHCHRGPAPDSVDSDHDPCLGTLPGVMNACCGHGRPEDAWVQLKDKSRLTGRAAIQFIEKAKEQSWKKTS